MAKAARKAAKPARPAAQAKPAVAVADEDALPPVKFCAVPPVAPRVHDEVVTGDRLESINRFGKLWANGTKISYYLFDTGDFAGTAPDMDATRLAFKTWKAQGIGLDFVEVMSPAKATLRIGFLQGDGSWSSVGTDNLADKSPGVRTMNIGWSLNSPGNEDTALHEIGHALGLSHEHQNPNAGIVWNEAKVRKALSGSPNFWSQDKIERNVLNKLDARQTVGSTWDPDSVMEYPFDAGLIDVPEKYRTHALRPAGGISKQDKKWVTGTYPPLKQKALASLAPLQSQPVEAKAGEVSQFELTPEKSDKFTVRLFGQSDATLLLYEVDGDGNEHYLSGASDAGNKANSEIAERLEAGKKYLVKVMVIYAPAPNALSVMYF